LELCKDRLEMDRDESVGVEKGDKFIQEVVRIAANKLKEIIKVLTIKLTSTSTDPCWVIDDITCLPPELQDAKPGPLGDATAVKDLLQS